MGGNRLFWGRGAGEGQPSREEPPNSVFAPALPNALTASLKTVTSLNKEARLLI